MIAKSNADLEVLRNGGRILAQILDEIAAAVRPGATTLELNRLAETLITASGGTPAFKGYRTHPRARPYPGSICTSVNDEVVHAIPSDRRALQDGDIIGIDIGMRWPRDSGLITDTARTVPVGKVLARVEELLRVTQEALAVGIRTLRPGIRMGDLGSAIQSHIESGGFSVVRDLVGHGVGKKLHEDPYVPNYGTAGEGPLIREGMVLAIEPMATIGNPRIELDPDGWTWRTRDGSLAAHFEHTVVVTANGVEVLTGGADQ